jgi:KipI family sensor histidine kinase inhibitor
VKLRRAGVDGLLVELSSLDEVLRYADALRRHAQPGIVEIVPAARTILVIGSNLDALAAELPHWRPPPLAPSEQPTLTIPVTYDGPDLDEVLRLTGLAHDELVALHTASEVTAAFCGFAPGFAYLAGLPARLHVARRATPRTRVEAGSVGLAGEFTGVYPRVSPGGWQIIGHTAMAMWDERRDPPHRLAPGDRVRFVRA